MVGGACRSEMMWMIFFFKQKTAYEMCGRDWSSDVCSSDLALFGAPAGLRSCEGVTWALEPQRAEKRVLRKSLGDRKSVV